jgi:hypothetical protein
MQPMGRVGEIPKADDAVASKIEDVSERRM